MAAVEGIGVLGVTPPLLTPITVRLVDSKASAQIFYKLKE